MNPFIIIPLIMAVILTLILFMTRTKPKKPKYMNPEIIRKGYLISTYFKDCYRTLNLAQYDIKKLSDKAPDDPGAAALQQDMFAIAVIKEKLRNMQVGWEFIAKLPQHPPFNPGDPKQEKFPYIPQFPEDRNT